jgi:alkylhydroperoxidase family enzyme
MRIPSWTPEAAPRDPALVDAVLERRGGKLLNLDRALLWSEPLARAWNVYLRAIRQEVSISQRLREVAICVVAKSTGAEYEFTAHWPHYVSAGGQEALRSKLDDPRAAVNDPAFSTDERLAMRYALAMTETVRVPDALFADILRRFSTTEVVELTAAIATYNMVARFLVALDVQKEDSR